MLEGSRPSTAVMGVGLPLLALACSGTGPNLLVRAGALDIGIDGSGAVVSLVDAGSGTDYLPPGHSIPLLTLRVAGEDASPLEATFRRADSILELKYDRGLEAKVRIVTRPSHATFELAALSDTSDVELAIWGPYPTTLRAVIGETVGVVQGEEFAMGIQGLNPRTLGGYPWNANDAMPQLDIFEGDDFSDLSEEGRREVLYRVEAAKPDSFGSTLQAYTRARGHQRVVPNWGFDRYTVPPFQDGGLVGSRIALFGCPVEGALERIGEIEVAEGLPHPLIDGEWGKTARSAAAAYVIMPFGESTVDEAVGITLRAGLRYLYHPDPFESWGHFQLRDDFPNGIEGLRGAVARAEARGVHLGVHTLSNFVTTNDPYVTPVPDSRLARVGTTTLASDLSEVATEVVIEDPAFFLERENDHLRAAVVGEEILQYRDVSEGPPWKLLDVERGAFGTRAASYEAGDSIGKLADHAYRVFLTDADLGQEMAVRLAELFNRTGLRQISFDGLEGNRSTGMGNYGEILFTSAWFNALSDDIRRHYIADASRTSHYFWHIYSRMNWGEPWYAGFRESQTEYRLKNQAYFRRNLMPGMLGWFRMQAETSVEDIEWMLARSAAFDAGYAFVTSFEALEENGRSQEILDQMGRWEEARMANAFTPEQKERMESVSNEFHLAAAGEEGWTLQQIHPVVFRHQDRERQPGEPAQPVVSFDNPGPLQPLRFILTAEGANVDGASLEVDGTNRVEVPVHLREGEALVYEGGGHATVYSDRWHVLGRVPVPEEALTVGPGRHDLLLTAALTGDGGSLKVELRLRGREELVAR